MTEQEHKEIVKLEGQGRLALGIDRAFARKFYTDVPLATIAEKTGGTVYLEKARQRKGSGVYQNRRHDRTAT